MRPGSRGYAPPPPSSRASLGKTTLVYVKRSSHLVALQGLVLRAIMDINLAKFVPADVPLFTGIVSDLFPDVAVPDRDDAVLRQSLQEACAALALQPQEAFLTKALQTHEMLAVRHGLMLVGHTAAGKTCAVRALGAALNRLDDAPSVQLYPINPKR